MRSLAINPTNSTSSTTAHASDRREKTINIALWVLQTVLSLLFFFAGGMKLVLPIEMMKGAPFPEWFLRSIGLFEVLGGLGLILPGITRIATFVTPLAAVGLVIIMVGATAMMIPAGIASALFPLIVGILAAVVAYGRWRRLPHRSR